MIEGRAWLFAQPNLNTDLIMPTAAFRLPEEERVKLVFSAIRPGWVEEVEAGDILVAGRNFGTGSGRPAAQLLRLLGLSAVVAESINELFYRNCVNYALPAVECPGVTGEVSEGDRVAVDSRSGTVLNLRSGVELTGTRIPDSLWEIIEAGGLYAKLEREGYF